MFALDRASLAFLSDLQLSVGGQPLQTHLSNLRILPELRGFLLISADAPGKNHALNN
jgi:hypothetical protein